MKYVLSLLSIIFIFSLSDLFAQRESSKKKKSVRSKRTEAVSDTTSAVSDTTKAQDSKSSSRQSSSRKSSRKDSKEEKPRSERRSNDNEGEKKESGRKSSRSDSRDSNRSNEKGTKSSRQSDSSNESIESIMNEMIQSDMDSITFLNNIKDIDNQLNKEIKTGTMDTIVFSIQTNNNDEKSAPKSGRFYGSGQWIDEADDIYKPAFPTLGLFTNWMQQGACNANSWKYLGKFDSPNECANECALPEEQKAYKYGEECNDFIWNRYWGSCYSADVCTEKNNAWWSWWYYSFKMIPKSERYDIAGEFYNQWEESGLSMKEFYNKNLGETIKYILNIIYEKKSFENLDQIKIAKMLLIEQEWTLTTLTLTVPTFTY